MTESPTCSPTRSTGRPCTAASTGPAASTTCSSTPASTCSRPCCTELFGHARSAYTSAGRARPSTWTHPTSSTARLVEAEGRANEIVTENRPVEVSFEEAMRRPTGLRKASAREGTLRIVTIRDLDRSACGGTHVRATGEIGPILHPQVGAGEEEASGWSFSAAGARCAAPAPIATCSRGSPAASPPRPMSCPRWSRRSAPSSRPRQRARRELEESLARYRARELYDTAPGRVAPRRIVVREERARSIGSGRSRRRSPRCPGRCS